MSSGFNPAPAAGAEWDGIHDRHTSRMHYARLRRHHFSLRETPLTGNGNSRLSGRMINRVSTNPPRLNIDTQAVDRDVLVSRAVTAPLLARMAK
jgi:hypothetical protein